MDKAELKMKVYDILHCKDITKQKKQVRTLLIKEPILSSFDMTTNMKIIESIMNDEAEYDNILKRLHMIIK